MIGLCQSYPWLWRLQLGASIIHLRNRSHFLIGKYVVHPKEILFWYDHYFLEQQISLDVGF